MNTIITPEERILQGATELFFRHGIRTITMDNIAAHLGISKKTIYQYYKDKNILVQALTEAELKSQHEHMQLLRKSSKDSVDEIMHLMEFLATFFNKVNPTLFYDLQKYHPHAWYTFKTFKEKTMIGFIEENLKRGIHQELYREELPVSIIARLRMEEVELGFNPRVFPPDRFQLASVQIALLDFFLHAIVTIKGHKLIHKYQKENIKTQTI